MRQLLAALLFGCLVTLFGTIPARADFSFIHVTDSHVTASEAEGSTAAKDAALFREMSGLDTPPAFVVHTGDVCETATDAEYATFRKVRGNLKVPLYVAPGNHDVRWNPRGKEGYTLGTGQPLYQSWTYQNIHFVLLDSTVLLQHWGHFDKAQLDWLADDLKKVGTQTPVIIGFHHWVGRETVQVDNEEALFNVLAPYNVRLFLIGHGHSDIQWNINGTPAVMAKGLYQGSYHLIKVTGSQLTVYRRTEQSGKPTVEVLSESLARPRRPRSTVSFAGRGGTFAPSKGMVQVDRGEFPAGSTASFHIDAGKDTPLTESAEGWAGNVDFASLIPGYHLLNVTLTGADNRSYRAPVGFQIEAQGEGRPLWQVSVGGEVQGKLVAANGTVYVPTMGGALVALDARTGKERWQAKTGGAVFSAPLVADGTVYFGSADHYVYAVNVANGKVRWKQQTDGAVFAGAAKAGNIVCIASTDRRIYGLDAVTGKPVWTARGLNMYQSQAATDGERFFVGGWDNYFRCLDARTGKERWKQPFGKNSKTGQIQFYFAPAIGSPTVGDGRVYVTSNDGLLHAMDAVTGNVLYEIPGPSLGYSGPLLQNGILYNASLTDNGRVFAFKASDGSKLWETPTGSVIYDSSCASTNGRVYVGCVNGVFSALRAVDGKLLWQYRLPPGHLLASPAVDDDRVYIGSLSGEVFAFGVGR